MTVLRTTAGLVVVAVTTAGANSRQDADPSDTVETVPPDGDVRYRWHTPRRNARDLHRHLLYPTADDWSPLAGPMHDLEDALDDVGIKFDFDVALLGQYASDVESGKHTLGSVLWQCRGDWRLLPTEELGTGYLSWNLLGGGGINYNAETQTLSDNVGSISVLNFDLAMQDPIIVNELFWKQHIGDLVLIGGKVDMSFHFDTNRVANDSFRQFNAFALTNNLSIPFPAYGGFGGLGRLRINDHLYVMAGIGDSSMDAAVVPWNTVENDSWYQLLELGISVDIDGLGKGTYRVTPWHNRLFGDDGWGLGLSFDQELGTDGLIGFFRFGFGNDSVTPVETFASGGLAIEGPFGRKHDTLAVGVAWSDPSPDEGVRDETLIETFYQFQLSPSLYIAPSVQVVLDPGATSDNDSSVIGTVRLTLSF